MIVFRDKEILYTNYMLSLSNIGTNVHKVQVIRQDHVHFWNCLIGVLQWLEFLICFYIQAIMRMKETAGAQNELNVEFLPLDLASFQSTKEFVRLFKEKNLPLHILVNNAGVASVPFGTCVCVCVRVRVMINMIPALHSCSTLIVR